MFGKKKKESTIKVNEAGEVTIEASVKDAAIAFFALPQFLIEQGMTEVQVKMNLDAAIKQLKKNKRLKMAIN